MTRTRLLSEPGTIARLRRQFAQDHGVVLPQLVESRLLDQMLRCIPRATFRVRASGPAGHEIGREAMVQETEPVHHFFNVLFNNTDLFELARQLTDCPPIGSFYGRVYRQDPDSDHFDSWHSDNRASVVLGVSINLSQRPYQGGEFQIRERDSGRITFTARHAVPGDAHVFDIGPGLQHRVAPVTGSVPRTAAAGWFLAQPDLRTAMSRLAGIPARSRASEGA